MTEGMLNLCLPTNISEDVRSAGGNYFLGGREEVKRATVGCGWACFEQHSSIYQITNRLCLLPVFALSKILSIPFDGILLRDREKSDGEVKRSVRRNLWRRPLLPVSQLWRDYELPLTASFHAHDPLIPALDYISRTEGEAELFSCIKSRAIL